MRIKKRYKCNKKDTNVSNEGYKMKRHAERKCADSIN